MFDKITIIANISNEVIEYLCKRHSLSYAYNQEHNQFDYMSNEFSNITGIKIFILGNKLTLKTSLYKLWNKKNNDISRNKLVFSITNAKSELKTLLDDNHLDPDMVYIKEYSLGLNLNVSYKPYTYIEKVNHIKTSDFKVMYNDACFQINYQKTTLKHKDIRKIYSICDEGYKLKSRKHQSDLSEINVLNILRLESFYRKYYIRADLFISDKNIDRLVNKFYYDWKSLTFYREVKGIKGSKGSELEMARSIIESGPEIYLQKTKEEFRNNVLTKNQYRTIREFIRDFNRNKNKYKIIFSAQETEYKSLLFNVLCQARN